MLTFSEFICESIKTYEHNLLKYLEGNKKVKCNPATEYLKNLYVQKSYDKFKSYINNSIVMYGRQVFKSTAEQIKKYSKKGAEGVILVKIDGLVFPVLKRGSQWFCPSVYLLHDDYNLVMIENRNSYDDCITHIKSTFKVSGNPSVVDSFVSIDSKLLPKHTTKQPKMSDEEALAFLDDIVAGLGI